MRCGIFPESASEGFLLRRSSAGAELSFPGRLRGCCGRVAAELPPKNRPIENLDFPEENQGFGGVGEAVAGPGPGPGPGPAEGILSISVILVHLGDFGLRPVIWEC